MIIHYPNSTLMRGVKHVVYLFFNVFSKTSIVNKTVTDHKEKYTTYMVLAYIKILILS